MFFQQHLLVFAGHAVLWVGYIGIWVGLVLVYFPLHDGISHVGALTVVAALHGYLMMRTGSRPLPGPERGES